MKNILVLCTGNSCRSQMAEGYLRYFANGKATIYSAGIEAHGVNPKAIQVMKEDGIDISNHTSKTIDELLSSPPFRTTEGCERSSVGREVFDYIITVCDNAQENCPYIPSKAKRFHQNFPDPAKTAGSEEEMLNSFRKIRGEIKTYSEKFIKDMERR